MSALRLADTDTRADLATYVARARSLDADGGVRLQATGTALAVWVGVLRGRGLMNDGTVVGLRQRTSTPSYPCRRSPTGSRVSTAPMVSTSTCRR